MRVTLAAGASERVLEATGGAFRVEVDGSVVVLVCTATDKAIPLVVADDGEPTASSADGRDAEERLAALVEKLSKRERYVFEQLGSGHEMAEIAAKMDISVKTVETYRARIKQKLDVKQRTQLLRKAVEWSLTNGDGRQNGDGKASAPGA